LGSAFVSATKRLMASWRSTTERNTALQALAREFGEESLDGIEPGCGGRGEVEHPAGMPRQPLAHLWMLVGRIFVDDGMDRLFDGDLCASIVLRKRMN
jgi:hypothetical protein